MSLLLFREGGCGILTMQDNSGFKQDGPEKKGECNTSGNIARSAVLC